MRTEDIFFAVYLGFGVLTLFVCLFLRYKRKKTSILWIPFSNDIFMILYMTIWPIFLPFLVLAIFSKGDKELEEERKWTKFEDD